MFINAAHQHSYEDVEGMIEARTGVVPVRIRCQALMVIGDFEDGSRRTFRIEDLLK